MGRRRLRGALRAWALLGGALAAAAWLAGSAGTPQLQRTMTDFLLLAALVVALQTFVGNSGIVSFGHVAFAGLGAYAAALVTIPPAIKEQALPDLPGALARAELGLVPSLVVATAVTVAVALLVGGALTRMSDLGMAMGTLALLVLVHAVLANWDSVTRGGYGIYGIPDRMSLWVALAGLLAVTLVALLYRASMPGLRLQATREDPLPARAVGVHVARTRLGSWVLSAALMGAAGALLAQHLLAFDPDQFFFSLTFTTLSMLVIGGRESVTGAVAGAGLITLVEDLLRPAERGFAIGSVEVPELPGLVQLTVAVLIILVLVFRPSGLLGRWELDELVGRAWGWIAGRLRRTRSGAELDGATARASVLAAGSGAAARRSIELGEPVLEVGSVTMDFAGLRALDGVSLSLRRGEILGLIGPNGSGKTTLLNVVSGVYRPTGGRVVLLGRDVTAWPAYRVARLGLARTFQNIRLFAGLTVRENLEAAAGRPDDGEVDRMLALFELERHQRDLAGTLAYGEQRRVEVARAAIRRPSVLLLDEPAAGMNEMESEQLLGIIVAVRDLLGCSIIVIDHDLRLILGLSDRVHVLNEGATIAEGRPEEVARDPAVVEAYLGSARAAG